MNKRQFFAVMALVGMYSDVSASLAEVRVAAGVLPRLLPVLRTAGVFGVRQFGSKSKNAGSELVPVQDKSEKKEPTLKELQERNEMLKLLAQNEALERQLGIKKDVESVEPKTFSEVWQNYKKERNRPKTRDELEEANLRSKTRFNNFFSGWTVVDGVFKVFIIFAHIFRK